MKMRKAMGTLGKNSSKYWSVIKDMDTQPINTLKDKHGKLAKTKQGTLDAAFDYFQDLFKAKAGMNPATVEQTSETPTLNRVQSKKVLHHIKKKEILKALKNLKNRKAAGPHGIPKEAFKIEAAVIAPILIKLFNTILSVLMHGILGSYT